MGGGAAVVMARRESVVVPFRDIAATVAVVARAGGRARMPTRMVAAVAGAAKSARRVARKAAMAFVADLNSKGKTQQLTASTAVDRREGAKQRTF